MKRYRDAIADLEKALSSPALKPMAHAGLAKAYRCAGNVGSGRRESRDGNSLQPAVGCQKGTVAIDLAARVGERFTTDQDRLGGCL